MLTMLDQSKLSKDSRELIKYYVEIIEKQNDSNKYKLVLMKANKEGKYIPIMPYKTTGFTKWHLKKNLIPRRGKPRYLKPGELEGCIPAIVVPDGYVVFDFDQHSADAIEQDIARKSVEAFMLMLSEAAPITSLTTMMVRTPSGGYHIWLKASQEALELLTQMSGLGPLRNVDIRSSSSGSLINLPGGVKTEGAYIIKKNRLRYAMPISKKIAKRIAAWLGIKKKKQAMQINNKAVLDEVLTERQKQVVMKYATTIMGAIGTEYRGHTTWPIRKNGEGRDKDLRRMLTILCFGYDLLYLFGADAVKAEMRTHYLPKHPHYTASEFDKEMDRYFKVCDIGQPRRTAKWIIKFISKAIQYKLVSVDKKKKTKTKAAIKKYRQSYKGYLASKRYDEKRQAQKDDCEINKLSELLTNIDTSQWFKVDCLANNEYTQKRLALLFSRHYKALNLERQKMQRAWNYRSEHHED